MKNVYSLNDIKSQEHIKALDWYENIGKNKIFSIIATCQAQEVYKLLISSTSPLIQSSNVNELILLQVICSQLKANALYTCSVERSLVIDDKISDKYNLKISWFK